MGRTSAFCPLDIIDKGKMRRYDIGSGTAVFLVVLLAFFGAFLVYPLGYVFSNAFFPGGRFSLAFFRLIAGQAEVLFNSLRLGLVTTAATTLLGLPLAFLMARYRFPGKGPLGGLLLVPMVLPPFVGAIGMRQMFARFGAVNLALLKLGVVSEPVDWFGEGGLLGVVILEVLHLYPIMYLNIAAALANVDPSLEEAGRNLGAGPFRLFWTVTFPLMAPGYFAGAIIVFLWAFTDLGTPLVFHYYPVVPVQIFQMVSEVHENPMGYAWVVVVLTVTVVAFYLSKRILGRGEYGMMGRGHTGQVERPLGGWKLWLAYIGVLAVVGLALLPHISVVLTSVAERWFFTVLPEEVSLKYYGKVFSHQLTLSSIRNSLFLSFLSAFMDLALGVAIAYILVRRHFPGKEILDVLAMLPLALPGIVLAFGYVAGFSGTCLDPRGNPFPLLIISYAVRRLPYMVRSAYAGFQQVDVALEEASWNLGAGPLRTLRRITLPLVTANLLAGGVLCFAFAMLEVSDSLILAMKEQFYPITKAIYSLLQRIEDGPYIASAMGVLGMVLLAGSLLGAGRILGRRMGELFRVR